MSSFFDLISRRFDWRLSSIDFNLLYWIFLVVKRCRILDITADAPLQTIKENNVPSCSQITSNLESYFCSLNCKRPSKLRISRSRSRIWSLCRPIFNERTKNIGCYNIDFAKVIEHLLLCVTLTKTHRR